MIVVVSFSDGLDINQVANLSFELRFSNRTTRILSVRFNFYDNLDYSDFYIKNIDLLPGNWWFTRPLPAETLTAVEEEGTWNIYFNQDSDLRGNLFEQFFFSANITVGRHSDPDFEQTYHRHLNKFDVPEEVREFSDREAGLIKKSHDFLVNENLRNETDTPTLFALDDNHAVTFVSDRNSMGGHSWRIRSNVGKHATNRESNFSMMPIRLSVTTSVFETDEKSGSAATTSSEGRRWVCCRLVKGSQTTVSITSPISVKTLQDW